MRLRRFLSLLLSLLLAGSSSTSRAGAAAAERPSERRLRILTISYGEFVPIDEVEGRREELVRRAFRRGTVRLEEAEGEGARAMAPGEGDLERALRGAPGAPSAGSQTQQSDPDDYDGDGFGPAAEVAPLRGEYIVDLPRISLDFVATIEPGIVVKKTATNTTEEFSKTYSKNTREEKYNASESQEFKSNVKGSVSLSFGNPFKFGLFKFLSLTSPKLDASSEYNRTRAWSRSVSTEVQRSMEEYFEQKRTSEITVEPSAGFLRSQLLLTNVTHFAAPIRITSLRAQAVAYSPRSGDKFAFGEVLLDGEILLFSGTGNNTATRFLQFAGINTVQMESALYEGYMFDFDISGDYQMASVDGTIDWRSRKSEAAAKSAWVQVNYGDQNFPVVRQVALQARVGGDLTVEKGLAEVFGAANVAFAQDPFSGRRIVTRISHRQNRHADRDFNTLTPAEQAEYGRWVIGYRFGTENFATDLFIDTTALKQDDVVALYFLTGEDMIPPPPVPDLTASFDLPAQGTIENGGALVVGEPVKPGDVVEIDATNRFTLYRQTSQHFNSTFNTVCQQTLFNATCHFRQVSATANDFVAIPALDWYGLKVSFGTTNPRTWLPVSQLGATVVQRSDFPEYRFSIRFTVTEAHLNQQPQGVLRVATEDSQGDFVVGCTGWLVSGQHTDCRQTRRLTAAEHAATGQVRWYKYTPDADTDGFTALYHFGSDWNDYDVTVFPGAPELWDGKDNDQDGQIERASVSGPTSLSECQVGSFGSQVDEFTGPVSYAWSRREITGSGNTNWVPIGTGPNVQAEMTCLDLAVRNAPRPRNGPVATALPAPETGFELRVQVTVEGSGFVSTATMRVIKSNPPPSPPPCPGCEV